MVATDFSERSHHALRRAVFLAKPFDASLSLVHVMDDDLPRRIIDAEQEVAEQLLAEQAATLRDTDGITCTTRVVPGAPFAGIVQASEDAAADLLIIGSHRRQVLQDVFIGTTAERTIRLVRCPVLMANSRPVGPYRQALLTTDLSDGSRLAVEGSLSLGITDKATRSILHVFDAPALRLAMVDSVPESDRTYYLQEERNDAERELAQFVSSLSVSGLEPWVRYDRTSVANEILTAATELGADLIVVGTRRRSTLKRMVLGSVAERVLRNAGEDVLAVPPQDF